MNSVAVFNHQQKGEKMKKRKNRIFCHSPQHNRKVLYTITYSTQGRRQNNFFRQDQGKDKISKSKCILKKSGLMSTEKENRDET